MLTTKAFQKGKELQTKFLNEFITPESGLSWIFIGNTASDMPVRNLVTEGRQKGYSGLDIWISPSINNEELEDSLRVRCLILDKGNGKYASPSYNLPQGMSVIGEDDDAIKLKALAFLENVYFLVVRKKGLSRIFWLDKYTNYPLEAYSLQARFKGRKDRLVLNYSLFNLKKFDYVDRLVQRLKKVIHES